MGTKKFTQTGRVVYDRKKHPFKISDLIRIGTRTDVVFYSVPEFGAQAFFRRLEECAMGVPGEVGVDKPGGGEFGGGGASRTWGSGSAVDIGKYRGICFIIEE